jgi:formylmethanofuran dehydrogenase subunit E
MRNRLRPEPRIDHFQGVKGMYIPDEVTKQSDYQECVHFHGHTCMGLTIGYLAAKLALEHLQVERAVDEELVAIVENDACCCDAVQVLTGCTFGKGNFFFKDHGKMAFTFANRSTGKSIRLVLKPQILDVPEEEQELRDLINSGQASTEEIRNYERMSESRLKDLFAGGPKQFFDIQELEDELPAHATIAPSRACASCGEMVMETKLSDHGGRNLCRACERER